jgi:hypothetical protein
VLIELIAGIVRFLGKTPNRLGAATAHALRRGIRVALHRVESVMISKVGAKDGQVSARLPYLPK